MSELTAEMIQRGPGEDRDESFRRERNHALRSVRERLTSQSGLERAFDYELLRLFAQQRASAASAIVILAGSVAAIGTIWLSPASLAAWLSMLCVTLMASVLLSRRFLATPTRSVSITTWRHRFIMVEAAQGAAWAVFISLLIMIPGDHAKVVTFFVVLLVAAVTGMFSSSIPSSVTATFIPVGTILLLSLIMHRDLNSVLIVAIGITAMIYFGTLAMRQYRNSIETLEFRAEKDALIAELEQAKANSDEARRNAEASNLAKSRFLATMSHELRTPLNAILGFSEVMKNELFGAMNVPIYREYAADIHGSGEHLLNLINEILDLSRIEAGRYEFREEAVTLAHLVEDCQHMLTLRAKSRGLTLTFHAEPNLPKIWADERAVRQVTLNLLSNAIKFTPQGGEIVIKVGWTAQGGQYLCIADNGPGIPEDEIPVVLESFGRGSLAIKTAEQGSGLGLPIVKGLMDLHGGTFVLQSKLREGTAVRASFPANRVMDTLAAIPTDDARDGRQAA